MLTKQFTTIDDFLLRAHKFIDHDEAMFLLLARTITQEQVVFLAVSWWPDSMYMAHLMFYYYFTKWRDLSKIIILHYNHKQRKTSDDEEIFICNYFWSDRVVVASYTWTSSSENMLRKARRAFLLSHLHGDALLCTWHHLSDRVETTFLHTQRWTRISGLLNMSITDTKTIDIDDWSFVDVTLFRPLLSLHKSTIQATCEQRGIPFFVDHTNTDGTLSKRNALRTYIQQWLTYWATLWLSKEDFWMHARMFYCLLEDYDLNETVITCELTPLEGRPRTIAYIKLPKPVSSTTLYHILRRYSRLGGITEKIIAEIVEMNSHTTWRKFFNETYFFHTATYLYILVAPASNWLAFREDSVHDTQDIMQAWRYRLWSFSRSLPEEAVWSIVRFPCVWDKRSWKTLKKRMMDKKIPFFLRNYIPVLEKDWNIVDVLPLEKLEWYM